MVETDYVDRDLPTQTAGSVPELFTFNTHNWKTMSFKLSVAPVLEVGSWKYLSKCASITEYPLWL